MVLQVPSTILLYKSQSSTKLPVLDVTGRP